MKNAFRWFCYWLFTIPALPWILGVRCFGPVKDGSIRDELRYAFIEFPSYLFDKE